ncbi:hypothetical protein ACF1FC_28955 [Streptomyces sp. NPDC014344]|uniref:hypothetical protein n=1 Tax=Streptomyces sp. NPDC014344 TaxID=3364871 RepID=UPI0036F8D955
MGEPVVRLLAGVSHSRTVRTVGCTARSGWSLHERAERTPAARPAEEDWERAVSTISREVNNNGGRDAYRAIAAQERALDRARRPVGLDDDPDDAPVIITGRR